MAEINSMPVTSPEREKAESYSDEKAGDKENGSIEIASDLQGDVYDDIRAIDMGEDGKERPIGMIFSATLELPITDPCSAETDIDVATRLISLEDDPSLPAFTFRMWFLGVGLSCFGAVLGQIFVSAKVTLGYDGRRC